MRRWQFSPALIRALGVLLFLGLAAPATAQLLGGEPEVAAPEAPAPIATTADPAANAAISETIKGIFAEIEPLAEVGVQVSAGVVTLSGTVPAANDIRRAEAIATRVAGVVTVENRLERNLAVDDNLSPALGKFTAMSRETLQALPLLGVAGLVGILIGGLGFLLASVDRLWVLITPNPFLAEVAATFIRFLSVVLGLVVMLEILGATALLSGVLGGAGVIGIALGFAVRDTVDNYVSSLMLSLRQPFRANDLVEIDGNEGRVVRLTSRATILMTLDGNHLRIPNSIVFKSIILNYTRNSQRRFSFDLGIDSEDDPIEAMRVGLAAVNALPFVLNAPKASAVIQNIGDSNVVLRFFGWLDQSDTDWQKGRSLAINEASHALTSQGFSLPEPIYRLRFDETAPLPMKPVETGKMQDAPRRQSVPPGEADTDPETHVINLVAEERRTKDGATDMLDSRRPEE